MGGAIGAVAGASIAANSGGYYGPGYGGYYGGTATRLLRQPPAYYARPVRRTTRRRRSSIVRRSVYVGAVPDVPVPYPAYGRYGYVDTHWRGNDRGMGTAVAAGTGRDGRGRRRQPQRNDRSGTIAGAIDGAD